MSTLTYTHICHDKNTRNGYRHVYGRNKNSRISVFVSCLYVNFSLNYSILKVRCMNCIAECSAHVFTRARGLLRILRIALCIANVMHNQLFFARGHVASPTARLCRSRSRIDVIINISVQSNQSEMKLDALES